MKGMDVMRRGPFLQTLPQPSALICAWPPAVVMSLKGFSPRPVTLSAEERTSTASLIFHCVELQAFKASQARWLMPRNQGSLQRRFIFVHVGGTESVKPSINYIYHDLNDLLQLNIT